MVNQKFKLKICTYDNEPIIKAKAEKIEDFQPVLDQLKKKFKGSR